MKYLPLTLLVALAATPGWADHYRPPTQDEIDRYLRILPSTQYQDAIRKLPTPMNQAEADNLDRLWEEHERLADREMTLPPCPSAEERMAAAERDRQARGGTSPPVAPFIKGQARGGDCYDEELREYRKYQKQYRAWHRAWMKERIDRDHPSWEDYLSQKLKEKNAADKASGKD